MRPVLEHVTAHILRDRKLAGYRIAVIGDFHLAPWRSVRALRYAIDAINAREPNLVALVGDYGYSVELSNRISRLLYTAVMPRVVAELSRLRASDGVFAVLGNHDIDADPDSVARRLTDAGVAVLRDTAHDVMHRGALLRVVGVDDLTRERNKVPVISALASHSDAALILSHHPDFVIRRGAPVPYPAIVVAGHTHGGQIALPFFGAPVTLSRVTSRRFPAGFVPNEHMPLYVSRGLGEQIPVRIRAKREITFLELAPR